MITVLAGGTGGARLARGMASILSPGELQIVVNTGDDWPFYGLPVSPDVDMLLYTLAGLLDEKRGWGIRGDSFQAVEQLRQLGDDIWFNLGDRDLAIQLKRSAWSKNGGTPTGFARWLTQKLQINAAVLPMTNDHIETRIITSSGDCHFEEYLLRDRGRETIQQIWFKGTETSQPTVEVLNAIRCSDVIIFGPSNPLVSIGPILSLPGMREEIALSRAVKLAVSPIVGGRALKGPLAQMMADLHMEISALGVVEYYRDLIDIFVLDLQDADFAGEIAAGSGLKVLTTDTLMSTPGKEIALARIIYEYSAVAVKKLYKRRQNPS